MKYESTRISNALSTVGGLETHQEVSEQNSIKQ
jgi:hypothetical protein